MVSQRNRRSLCCSSYAPGERVLVRSSAAFMMGGERGLVEALVSTDSLVDGA